MFLEKNRGHIGHAHRHAGMAGIGGVDRIQRQGADGGGARPMVRMGGSQGGNVQGIGPSSGDMTGWLDGLDSSLPRKFKRRL